MIRGERERERKRWEVACQRLRAALEANQGQARGERIGQDERFRKRELSLLLAYPTDLSIITIVPSPIQLSEVSSLSLLGLLSSVFFFALHSIDLGLDFTFSDRFG